MNKALSSRRRWLVGSAGMALCAIHVAGALAQPPIRNAFFNVYPEAEGTILDNVPGIDTHCGVCHYRFTGSGDRNPYGALLEAELPNWGPNETELAILAIEDLDPDGDGFSTLVEVTDLINYPNTPTFPGLSPANVDQIQQIDPAVIEDFLVPEAAACVADLDGDGMVGTTDLLEFLASWGECPGCAADFDGDGFVTTTDLLDLLAGWGDCA